MARKLKISASVINVALHPHSPAIYAEFFAMISKLRIVSIESGKRSKNDPEYADDGGNDPQRQSVRKLDGGCRSD